MESNGSNAPMGVNPGFRLNQDEWGRLVLTDPEGRRQVGVEPVRGFPLTDPDRWISLCDADGREVLFIESMADLPEATRRILNGELALRVRPDHHADRAGLDRRLPRRLGRRDRTGTDAVHARQRR